MGLSFRLPYTRSVKRRLRKTGFPLQVIMLQWVFGIILFLLS